MTEQGEVPGVPLRDETPAERLDRVWGELLQELRITQTGSQLLTAFLVSLPFQARFSVLGDRGRTIYLVTLATAAVGTILLVTPVAMHRLLFGEQDKQSLVDIGGRLARFGLTFLGLTLTGTVALIADVLLGPWWSLLVALLTLSGVVGLWLLLPLRLRAALRHAPGSER